MINLISYLEWESTLIVTSCRSIKTSIKSNSIIRSSSIINVIISMESNWKFLSNINSDLTAYVKINASMILTINPHLEFNYENEAKYTYMYICYLGLTKSS